MSVSIDDSELRALAADLVSAANVSEKQADKVVKDTARELMENMRSDAKGSRHFRLEKHITAEMTGAAQAEVGPEKVGAGNLGHIAYYGGANGGGGTVRKPEDAAKEIAPTFEKALAAVVEDVL